MRARLEGLMETCGQSVTLTRLETGDTVPLRAFLQPILKRREALPAAPTPLGAVSSQRWLYIGSGRQEISPGDRAACGAERLVVQEARPIRWGDEVLYYWAVLRQERRNAAE